MIYEEYLELIKEKMLENNITNYRISKEVGKAQIHITKIINGDVTPNAKTFLEILKVVGIKINVSDNKNESV